MRVLGGNLNIIVAALAVVILIAQPLWAADEDRLDNLLADLKTAEPADARRIAKEIQLELSKSGSPAMDLLLKRGRDALKAGDSRKAIGFFTALTDHAPEFAEGWHMRAIAYAKADLYGPAIADLERALALRPRHFNAIFSLGSMMEEVNRPAMALDAYRRALAIHPYHEGLSGAVERVAPEVGGADL
jgi:tetratricopeptide (TPR) repeat protein